MRFFLAIAVFLSFFSFGQSSSQQLNVVSRDKVTTIGYWSKADKKSYRLLRTRSEYKRDKKKPSKVDQSEYNLRVSVLDSTDSSYLLRMEYRKLTSNNESSHFSKLDLRDYHIDYVTDEYGVFDSIANLPELKVLVKEYLVQLVNSSDSKGDSLNAVISNAIDELLNSDELLDIFFQRDISLLHAMYGIELKLGDKVNLELEYPPIGEVIMRGKGTIELKNINLERDYCRIFMTQKPNAEEVDLFLFELLRQFSRVDSVNFNPEEVSFSTSSRLNGSMELSTGWMKRVANKTTVTTTVKNKKLKTDIVTEIEEN